MDLHTAYPEIEANGPPVAAELLAHPASLLLTGSAVAALADIAVRDPPSISASERRLLRRALNLVDEVEIRIGMEVRQ